MRYLLDTCLVSEATRPSPNPGVMTWLGEVDDEKTFLSVVTIGELAQRIAQLSAGKKQRRLKDWLDDELLIRFAHHLLPLSCDVMLTWGQIVVSRRALGKPMPILDSLIAATAVQHGLHLVTRNIDDFADTGVEVFDPWQ